MSRLARLSLISAVAGIGILSLAADTAVGGGTVAESAPPPSLDYIPLDQIRLNPVAIRDVEKSAVEFQELVDSIRKSGVLTAILIRRQPGSDGKQYELVDGLQRFSASAEAGLTKIPAQIVTLEESDRIAAQVIGNAVRLETKPVEYAKGLMKILGYNPTWTEADLASKVNKSPAWIGRQLGLLKLHDQIKPLVNDGKVVVANAYALAKLPQDEQLNWLERAQTTDANQFTQQVLERVKAIREANRKGENAGEEQFVPVFHLRKKPEIEGEIKNPEFSKALIADLKIAGSAKNKDEAALAGFLLGLQWVGNMDPKSIEARKAKFEEQKKKDAEDKVRRDAEKKEKRAKEAEEAAAKAKKDADAAKAAAANLPAKPAEPAQV